MQNAAIKCKINKELQSLPTPFGVLFRGVEKESFFRSSGVHFEYLQKKKPPEILDFKRL